MATSPNICSKLKSTQLSPSTRIPYHPPYVMYLKPLETCEVDFDINNTVYYKKYDDIAHVDPIELVELRVSLLSSAVYWEPFIGRFMLIPSGEKIFPSHLPLLCDSYGMHRGWWDYLQWELQNLGQGLIPENLLPIFDPKPQYQFDNLAMYAVPTKTSPIFVCSFTDSIHVMELATVAVVLHVQVYFSYSKKRQLRFHVHKIKAAPTSPYSSSTPIIPKGKKIVCWNARGMNRPCFVRHFYELYQRHQPTIMVVTESRNRYEDLLLIKLALPLTYELDLYGPIASPGGVVVLWCKGEVQPMAHPLKHPDVPQIVQQVVNLLFHGARGASPTSRRSLKQLFGQSVNGNKSSKKI